MKIDFYRPFSRSVLSLTLIGFAIVALPLIVAVITATVWVDQHARMSQQAIVSSIDATQYTRTMMETLVNMERNIRQFDVLKDEGLLKLYLSNHSEFQEVVQDLQDLVSEENMLTRLAEIGRQEMKIYSFITAGDVKQAEELISMFAGLNSDARELWLDSNRYAITRAEHMKSYADDLQQQLLWQAVLVIPLALIFVVLFTYLIVRPIRQLENSVHQMGGGDFGVAIRVKGPQDIENLGTTIDWLRRRLLELENQKQKFMRNISHELKTPLATIREGSDLLADEVVGELNQEQHDIANILRTSSSQLYLMIENLLHFNRLQSEDAKLNLSAIRVDEVIQQVIDQNKLPLLSRNLVVQFQSLPLTACVDAEKFRIVIDNLVSNAVKYSNPGGQVDVVLRDVKDRFEVNVTDNGPGISQDERESIFDSFVRGRAADDGSIKGTGLGLAIVREYVEMHGGSVSVKDGDSGGACFVVQFPLIKSE